jgi:hypothetical protein
MALKFNREELLDRLEKIKYEAEDDADAMQLEQSSLGKVLLTLAEVNHEREYELCRGAALHLLGKVNEPEDIVLD